MLFGDSLSDNGNGIGQLYGQRFPAFPYFDFRFSNGPVWVEYIPNADLLDYAYGGATANQSVGTESPSLMGQINDYLISKHFNLTSIAFETQYIFVGGSNDVLDAMSNKTLTAQGVNGDLAALAVTLPLLIASQIEKLISFGATYILVALLPDPSASPSASQSFSVAQLGVLSQLMAVINEGISSNVSVLAQPGISLKLFDTPGFFQAIKSNANQFGLRDVTDPCFQNYQAFIGPNAQGQVGGQAAIVCSNPEQFLFWDGVHPTTGIHALVGQEIMSILDWQG